MALRHNRLVSALPLRYLATAGLCVLVLANLRGQGSTRDSASQDSKQTSSGVLASNAPTYYYSDVLPILRQHCVACHRGGGIAPMSFETYEGARRYAYLIRNVTQDKSMPFSIPRVGRVTKRSLSHSCTNFRAVDLGQSQLSSRRSARCPGATSRFCSLEHLQAGSRRKDAAIGCDPCHGQT